MMNPKPKVKLCWNCEGRVSFKDENCPYCAVYLHPESNQGDDEDDDETPLDPPYRVISNSDNPAPKAPYAAEEVVKDEETFTLLPTEGLKHVLAPLALLLFGSTFFLFGIILLLFSQEGIFTLRWNANIWFMYELLAIPLLFLGWRTLNRFKEDEESV